MTEVPARDLFILKKIRPSLVGNRDKRYTIRYTTDHINVKRTHGARSRSRAVRFKVVSFADLTIPIEKVDQHNFVICNRCT